MAKPLTSWLVPSFSQHNLRLVVSERYLHFSVTKFQDKSASLRQVNSPYSWNKFQICCTDMYLIGFLLNFGVFYVFLWISRIYLNFTAPWPREISEGLYWSLNWHSLYSLYNSQHFAMPPLVSPQHDVWEYSTEILYSLYPDLGSSLIGW